MTTEAFQSAIEVIRSVLGFDPEVDPTPPAKTSRLMLNKPKLSPSASSPVDTECSKKFHEIAKRKRWFAYPVKAAVMFKVDESDGKSFFAPLRCQLRPRTS